MILAKGQRKHVPTQHLPRGVGYWRLVHNLNKLSKDTPVMILVLPKSPGTSPVE